MLKKVLAISFISLQVFDAYAQFEEGILSSKMEKSSEENMSEEGKTLPTHIHLH